MSVEPDVAKEAQTIFDHAGGRSMRAYKLILSLLEFMRHGAASAKEGLVVDAAQAVRELVSRADFGPEEQRRKALASMSETADGAADRTIADATLTAEAASIVFMHSMVDAAVDDYLRICAMLDPTDWAGEVETEKVTLAQARGDWNAPPWPETRARRDERAVGLAELKIYSNSTVYLPFVRLPIYPRYQADGDGNFRLAGSARSECAARNHSAGSLRARPVRPVLHQHQQRPARHDRTVRERG